MQENLDIYDNRVKWQIDCDNTIKDKDNVILSSPTGSGKTKRYESWALNKLERPIFITSPIKALSNQRFRELQESGYRVGLETGDVKYIPSDSCDIICCTQEIYNNKYRDYGNSTLIIDEFSYIFEAEERARAYIDSLLYSKAKNIMLCSATFGNSEEIKNYISMITNRDFFLYENGDRLTTLEYKGSILKTDIRNSLVVAYSKDKCEQIAQIIYHDRISKIKKNSISVFDAKNRNRKEILQLAKKYYVDNGKLIELATMGVVYYYGALFPKEKMFIEELFENRLIDTVVGTDALALGVNFPIKNVVFTELWKNNKQNSGIISKNLFEQLSGRAGRKGYFDDGYVYYCSDFLVNKDEKNLLEKLFYKLVNCNNEEVTISLDANIGSILSGHKTIEEEALFITKYSTTDKDYETERQRIKQIIDYITTFDIAFNYLSRKFYNFDFSKGYYNALENCSQKIKNKIEKLSNSLMKLQPYFDKDIGLVYLSEYSPQQNCLIFIDILLETPMNVLIKKYGKSIREILILRKYMHNLPKKYSKNYDLSLIEKEIDNMDYTVLHPEKFKMDKIIINHKNETISKKKNKKQSVYKCPSYFDKISVNGKTYVKILVDVNYMIVCDYYDEDNVILRRLPINIGYKVTGLIRPNKGLAILNKIDLNTLIKEDEEVVDQIEGMRLCLTNKYKVNI